MTLDHVAIWTNDPELLKNYYVKYFGGRANKKYTNKATHFESYFISFSSGCRLEIMKKPGIPENLNDPIGKQYQGIIHLAFDAGSMEKVTDKARELEKDGFTIIRGPRISGDGYYEFETSDPDNNRIEIITRFVE